jgi:signal transduction histidine kinase
VASPAVPARIALLLHEFVAEELGSTLRHGLRNKLAAIRNATFYLHKKVQSPDARVEQMLELIETELASTEELLKTRLAPPDPAAQCDAGAVASALSAELGVQMEVEPAVVRANAAELELALFCLIENAYAAGATHVKVACHRRDGRVALEVSDDGPIQERDAIGPIFDQAIARRIASRSGAALELAPGRATLLLAEAGE